MRLLRTCHALAMLCWWGGFVVLAVLLLAPGRQDAMREGLPDLVRDAVWAWGGHSLRANQVDLNEATTAMLLDPAMVWVIWYRSPLNIHHWGIAMLCFTPALGLTLLTRHLAWRRQH